MLVHRGRNVIRLPPGRTPGAGAPGPAERSIPGLLSIPFDVKPAKLLRTAKELGLEGFVAKRKGSLYEPGRSSRAWVKYTHSQSQEFVIGGYTAGNPFDALIVGCYEAGKLKYVGKVRKRVVLCRTCAVR